MDMKTFENCTECGTTLEVGFICCPMCGKSINEMVKEEEMEEEFTDYEEVKKSTHQQDEEENPMNFQDLI